MTKSKQENKTKENVTKCSPIPLPKSALSQCIRDVEKAFSETRYWMISKQGSNKEELVFDSESKSLWSNDLIREESGGEPVVTPDDTQLANASKDGNIFSNSL